MFVDEACRTGMFPGASHVSQRNDVQHREIYINSHQTCPGAFSSFPPSDFIASDVWNLRLHHIRTFHRLMQYPDAQAAAQAAVSPRCQLASPVSSSPPSSDISTDGSPFPSVQNRSPTTGALEIAQGVWSAGNATSTQAQPRFKRSIHDSGASTIKAGMAVLTTLATVKKPAAPTQLADISMNAVPLTPTTTSSLASKSPPISTLCSSLAINEPTMPTQSQPTSAAFKENATTITSVPPSPTRTVSAPPSPSMMLVHANRLEQAASNASREAARKMNDLANRERRRSRETASEDDETSPTVTHLKKRSPTEPSPPASASKSPPISTVAWSSRLARQKRAITPYGPIPEVPPSASAHKAVPDPPWQCLVMGLHSMLGCDVSGVVTIRERPLCWND